MFLQGRGRANEIVEPLARANGLGIVPVEFRDSLRNVENVGHSEIEKRVESVMKAL